MEKTMINWANNKSQLPDISFEERTKHMGWCIDNDIIINFIVQSFNVGFLRINDKGNITDYCGANGVVAKYKQVKLRLREELWSKKVYELYSEFYIKYNPEFIPLKKIKRDERKERTKRY
jgi:hypothetical protein